MLVLTRKLGERIFVGGDITIEVLDVRRGDRNGFTVRLGITAPPETRIVREEIAHQDVQDVSQSTARPGGAERVGGPEREDVEWL